ncbi:hypothetical protein AB0H73_30785 [Streptomyces olivoreticuli]
MLPSVALGVGSSSQTSAARHFPCVPAFCEGLRLVCRFSFSEALGVGSSETTCRRFIPPCAACPAPVASDVDGVGSRDVTAVGSCPFCPPPRQSRAAGVGRPGEDEEAVALVGSADLRRAYKAPLRIEPEGGKVGEDGVESESKVIRDVLKDRESGS